MSVNSKIIAAVSGIAPCYPWEAYEGSGDNRLGRYFVFNYTVMPYVFGDNDAPFERYLIQLHYFCPREDNTVALRRKIKWAVFDAGFTIPTEENASDEDGQHYAFEFETLERTWEEENDGTV